MLKVGQLCRYDGRIWRIGLVNTSRARLDPVSGFSVTSPVSGKGSFLTYGTSVNVSPNSTVEVIEEEALSDAELRRLMHLEERDGMASNVAAPPVGEVKEKSLKEKNQERRAGLEQKKAAEKEEREKRRAEAKAEKVAKSKQPCKCGCGQLTGGFFFPGHDARFKGWMLQIERGQKKPPELLTEEVIKSYKWVKTEKGLRTTTNYKGEAHDGYDQSAK